MSGSPSFAITSTEHAKLDRRRRRVLLLTAIFLALPVVAMLVAWGAGAAGEPLPRGVEYRWSGTGNLLILPNAGPADCVVSSDGVTKRMVVPANTSPFRAASTDVIGSSTGTNAITCYDPVRTASGALRLVLLPARHIGLLLYAWPLIGLWSLTESILLVRRRLRLGDLRVGR